MHVPRRDLPPQRAALTLRTILALALVLCWNSAAAQVATASHEEQPMGGDELIAHDDPTDAFTRATIPSRRYDSPQLHIPEPMVFDLVRGLGARAGEIEANTLLVMPFDSGQTEALWAPEIEWAPVDNFAIEFELPFHNDRLEALKFAIQPTFSSAPNLPLQHGAQVIVEHLLGEGLTELTGLYLLGLRFNNRWSVFTMTGARLDVRTQGPETVHMLQNLTVFRQFGDHIALGIENNLDRALNGTTTNRTVAQFHWELTQNLEWQMGGGVISTPEGFTPLIATRFIVSHSPNTANATLPTPDGGLLRR